MPKRGRREELAAQLQAEKDQLDDWEITPSQPPKEPSVSISLRLPPDDVDRLQVRAAEQGTSVSAVVRVAIHRYFDPSRAPSVRFVFMGPAKFSEAAQPPFTEARTYTGETPDPKIIRFSA